MRKKAWEKIGHLYPKVDGKTVIAWLWARTVQSPDPSWKGHVPLLKSGVIRNRPGKPVVWVEPIVNRDSQTVTYQVRESGKPSGGNIGRGGGVCIATGATIGSDYIRQQSLDGLMGEDCIGVVVEGNKGREYVNPGGLLDAEPLWKPEQPMNRDSTDLVSGRGYGFYVWGDLFTSRQLVALTTFSDLLSKVREMVERDARDVGVVDNGIRLRDGGSGVVAYADTLVTYLAFVVDRCAARWLSLSPWNTSGEKIEHVFGRQAIPMIWDYAEANPFSTSTGNWFGQVTWVVKSVSHFPDSRFGEVLQRDAVARLV